MSRRTKFLKWMTAVIAAVCCLLLPVLPASALRKYEDSKMNCQLYDPEGLFSPEDQEILSDLIREASDETDMYVAVQVVVNAEGDVLSDDEVMKIADDRYDELFNVQYGEESDGLLLMIYMPSHYLYISTCGTGQLYYAYSPEDRISDMIEHMTDRMRNEEYSGAVTTFCTDVMHYYEKGIPNRTYSYDSKLDMYYWQENGELVSGEKLPLHIRVNLKVLTAVSVLVGMIAAFITMLIVESSYQMEKSLNPSNYISGKDTNFYQQDDVFIREHTTKTHIDSDRSGGGGGGNSSHMSSGGFSHGGGGGHW